MLGIFFTLSIALVEKFFFDVINKSTNPNIIIVYKSIVSTFFMYICFILFGNFINFFNDLSFYILIAIEFLVIFYSKYLFYLFKHRFVYISYALFSSIYLTPLISYFYKDWFGFSNNIKFIFEDFTHLFIFSLTLFIMNSIYFLHKLKSNKEKNSTPLSFFELFLLIIFGFFMANAIYFSVSMIQKYDPFSLYSVIFIFHIIIFGIIGIYKRESFKLNSFQILTLPSVIIALLLSIFGAKLLAVEFFAVFKRLGSLYAGYFFDYKNNTNYKFDTLEIIMLLTITFFVLSIYILF